MFRDVVSGPAGTYFASQLVPGTLQDFWRSSQGFQATERSGLVLQVGKTLTINLSLNVGGLEETVRVTAESPLVDTTSAKVGGNIGTTELSELPAMNRNYFATVALLPGVQFSPSNQMGNDTIVAAGQSTQGNNVSVDGGYNGDDALRHELGRAGAHAARSDPGVPGHHEHVRRRVGPRQRRHRQRRHQGRDESVQGRGVRGAGQQRADGRRLFRQDTESGEADVGQTRLGRRARRTDRQEQGALLLQPRAAGGQSEPDAHVSVAAVAELRDRRGSHRLEHADPLRPPDQQEQHVGGPLAARVGAAVVDGAGRQELRRRRRRTRPTWIRRRSAR